MREQILRSVQDELRPLPRLRRLRNANAATWTRAVKSAVRRAVVVVAGHAPGLCICAHGLEERDNVQDFDHQREWLFDIACLQYAGQHIEKDINYFDRPLKKVLLVGECEWGRERMIHNDFEKLLLARADMKLMVYDGEQMPEENKFSVLRNFVSRFGHTHADDAYLFVARAGNHFQFDHYIVT